MPGQNNQMLGESAKNDQLLRDIGGSLSGYARKPGPVRSGFPPSPAFDDPAQLLLPSEAARSHEIPTDLEAAPVARERLATAVLVVDDCTLYRENLAVALASYGDVSAYVAWDIASLLSTLETYSPDVILLSMSTKDGAAMLRTVTVIRPDVKVIAVGVGEGDEATIVSCAEAGVTGYHLRDESLDDLISLIDKITCGDSVCSPRVAGILLRQLSKLASQRKPDTGELVLTAREVQILRMLEMGLSNREIANQLCIALHTVKNHVHSVLGKLGVGTRAQAVAVSRSLLSTEVGSRDLGTAPV